MSTWSTVNIVSNKSMLILHVWRVSICVDCICSYFNIVVHTLPTTVFRKDNYEEEDRSITYGTESHNVTCGAESSDHAQITAEDGCYYATDGIGSVENSYSFVINCPRVYDSLLFSHSLNDF
jgi:hypothetical protein